MSARRIRTIALLVLITTTIGCDRVTKHVALLHLQGGPSQSYFADIVRLEYAIPWLR